jgi:hypothetical protein
MIRFFKQLFCKHPKWICIYESFGGITFKCTKCGKEKTYWEYK